MEYLGNFDNGDRLHTRTLARFNLGQLFGTNTGEFCYFALSWLPIIPEPHTIIGYELFVLALFLHVLNVR